MTPPPTVAGAARVRAATAVPAPLRLPPAPRRVSGPARSARIERTPTGASAIALRLIDHPWLERLIRGRAWIAIVATALLGIVAMQVALLRVGAQIGSETAAVNALQQQNAQMQYTIGAAEASRGLGASPSSLGMLFPPPGAVTYLQLNPGVARLAAERVQSPSAAALAAAAAHPLQTVTHVASTTAATTHTATTGATGGVAATGTTGGAGATATNSSLTGAGSTTTSTPPATTQGTLSTTTGTPSNTASNTTSGTATDTPTTNTPLGAATTTSSGGTTAPPAITLGAGGTNATGG